MDLERPRCSECISFDETKWESCTATRQPVRSTTVCPLFEHKLCHKKYGDYSCTHYWENDPVISGIINTLKKVQEEQEYAALIEYLGVCEILQKMKEDKEGD